MKGQRPPDQKEKIRRTKAQRRLYSYGGMQRSCAVIETGRPGGVPGRGRRALGEVCIKFVHSLGKACTKFTRSLYRACAKNWSVRGFLAAEWRSSAFFQEAEEWEDRPGQARFKEKRDVVCDPDDNREGRRIF